MEREFIENLQKQWQAVKENAARECDSKNLPNLAQAYRDCKMFRGDETTEELAELIKSVRGREFCLRYSFPNIASLRCFKKDHPERYGVFIDGGSLHLKNPDWETVVIAGRVAATIDITDNSRTYEIVLLAGAKAVINARHWSVVALHQAAGTNVIKNATENAIIL